MLWLILQWMGGMAFQPVTSAHAQGLELHTHLFMQAGLSPLFRGEFYGPLAAKHWDDRFLSKTNAETLDQSNRRLVVISLYAHPALNWDRKESIRKQIRMMHEWISRSGGRWVFARSPREAEQALARGARVLVLSLETASGVLDTPADVAEFIDREGIRIVTFHHLTGDAYGGSAFLKGNLGILAAPWAYLQSLRAPDFDGVARLNPNGMTHEGAEMARTLMERGVWLDLAHAPDRSYDVLLEWHRKAHKPLLFTHTILRKFLGAERGLSDRQLKDMAQLGGFVGLMPSEDMLVGTPSTPCTGSVHALKVHYDDVARWLGSKSIAWGSDFNGGIRHLKTSCSTGTTLDQTGYWNFSHAAALEGYLMPRWNATSSNLLTPNIREFLRLWQLAQVSTSETPRK